MKVIMLNLAGLKKGKSYCHRVTCTQKKKLPAGTRKFLDNSLPIGSMGLVYVYLPTFGLICMVNVDNKSTSPMNLHFV